MSPDVQLPDALLPDIPVVNLHDFLVRQVRSPIVVREKVSAILMDTTMQNSCVKSCAVRPQRNQDNLRPRAKRTGWYLFGLVQIPMYKRELCPAVPQSRSPACLKPCISRSHGSPSIKQSNKHFRALFAFLLRPSASSLLPRPVARCLRKQAHRRHG